MTRQDMAGHDKTRDKGGEPNSPSREQKEAA